LSANDNYSVELRGFFKPSIYEALRGFVVEPAQVNIVLTDRAGKEHAGRHIPLIAKAGFVVQPLSNHNKIFPVLSMARFALRFAQSGSSLPLARQNAVRESTCSWRSYPIFPCDRCGQIEGISTRARDTSS
jgi:hypothetical protein